MLFFYSKGQKGHSRIRPLIAYIIFAVLVYRFVLVALSGELQVRLVRLMPLGDLTFAEAASALVQSLFTIALDGGSLPSWPSVFHLLGFLLLLAFWLVVGPGLEDRLGRLGLGAVFLTGGLAGLWILQDDRFAVSDLFWVGLTANLACLGASLATLPGQPMDVRYGALSYRGWVGGGLEIPPGLLSFPAAALLVASQSLFWVARDDSGVRVFGRNVRPGLIDPVYWCLGVLILGAVAGVAWVTVFERSRSEE